MSDGNDETMGLMPYSMVEGQEQLKLALELAYLAPRIGGVLLSGERGTGKSTVVRAFAVMVEDQLPVTLPINATEDRVVGGWDIDELLKSQKKRQPGLLEEADKRFLYIDEVNLLDDHIVNLILDVASTGILVIEREGGHEKKQIRVTLIGTMNPAEGSLRPQLLDRFGLMVDVVTETDPKVRVKILQAVLDFDSACAQYKTRGKSPSLTRLLKCRKQDQLRKKELAAAKDRLRDVSLAPELAECCVQVAGRFQVEGHRGDYVMALAARARAALRGASEVAAEDLAEVAPLALQHRRPGVLQGSATPWSAEMTTEVRRLLKLPPDVPAVTDIPHG